MVELLLGVLMAGLKLKNTLEDRKYLDEVIALRQEWLNEYNKPKKCRSNAAIDAIELRLGIIARAFIDTAGK